MKIFQLSNTADNYHLPQDSIILFDQRGGCPIIIIRTPWTTIREYYDFNTFEKRTGPCFFTWSWKRKANDYLVFVKGWIGVNP